MASTYSVGEVLEIVKRTSGLGAADSWGWIAADLAVKEMWRRGAWRESLEILPVIGLVPGLQDLAEPLVDIPADMAGLWKAEYVYLTDTGNVSYEPLKIMRTLEANEVPGPITAISFLQEEDTYRFPGLIPDNAAAPWHYIRGTYKKKPPSVTNLNIGGLYLPWEDDLLPVFIQVLRWQALALVGSEKAPQQQQLALSAIEEAARTEAAFLGQSQQISSIDVGGW